MKAGRVLGTGIALCCGLAAAGCLEPQRTPQDTQRLRNRAVDCLKRGVRYEPLPTVRANSIEALQETVGTPALPWIRQGLDDDNPGVRFAAAVALGRMRDTVAQPAIRKLLQSKAASDRIAGIFALHRLGDASHTAELAGYLIDCKDVADRRHAALVLGRLGEKGAIQLLARVMGDPDTGLRANALESMALLGSPEARSTLYANAYGGIGEEETFALMALGALRDPKLKELFEQKLATAPHVETRLAAARCLGMLGDKDGLPIAMKNLTFTATKDRENDPAANQTLRVRELAALACGAIGDARALGSLEKMMNEGDDPRLQVAAAKAILQIVGTPVEDNPFEHKRDVHARG